MIKRLQLQKNLHTYTLDSKKHKFNKKILITSDWHFDNPKCNRKLLFKHLDQAKEENALIIINGDMLCLMQGQYDPRRNKSAIRPEHNGDNYLDLVINDTAEKLKPYAHLILQINEGNHESSVSKRSETNVLQRLVERLNTIANTNIQLGSYAGLIILNLCYQKRSYKSLKIGYSHGNWGGIVSKGTQSVGRYASYFPDADIFISGHTHDGWIMNHPRYKYNQNKQELKIVNQWHIKTGTYKEEFEGGSGWAVERIAMPKYLGSCWCNIYYEQKKDLEYTFELTF